MPIIAPLTTLSVGVLHTCATNAARAGYCWGWNRDGQLGDGSTADRLVPTTASQLQLSAITAGGGHTCGLTPQHEPYCWGFNQTGQLGDGTPISRTVPLAVAGEHSFTSISAGGAYTCAVDLEGGGFCWGWGELGQLGDGAKTVKPQPAAVLGGHAFTTIVAGVTHTCGLVGGAAYCWGQNTLGELGSGTASEQLEPTAVLGGLTFTEIAVAARHTCARTPAGDIYCWGDNSQGQAGTGPETPAFFDEPTLLPSTETWASVTAGGSYTCAVTSDGRGFCWGSNANGQLGHESSNTCAVGQGGFPQPCTLVPTAVDGDLTFQDIRANTQHTCGLVGGVAYCWGLNNHGQLGIGSANSTSLPARVANQESGG